MRYHFTIATIKDDNSPGPSFNCIVKANNPIDACDEAKKDLLDTFKSQGLTLVDSAEPGTKPAV